MNRQGSGPGRSTYGRVGDAAFAERDAYQRDSYLEAGAYPVDPGYQAYAGGRDSERPRPADIPPGPSRTRPERGMPPRTGYPPRSGRQAAYDRSSPWQRPEDAMPGVGRPRPRPTGPRPRQAPPGQPRPGQPPRPAPPRGPRPAGFYEPQGPAADAYAPGQGRGPSGPPRGPQVPGYPGQPGPRGQQPPGYQGQNFPGQGQGRPGPPPGYPPAQEWAGGGMPGQPGGMPPGQGQPPWPGPQGPAWPGAGGGPRPGQGPYPQEQQWAPGPFGYGQGEPAPGPGGYAQGPSAPGPYDQGQPPAGGRYGQAPGQMPFVAGPYSANPYAGQAGGPQMPGQFAQDPRGPGAWQAAGPEQGAGWSPGEEQFGPGQFGEGQFGEGQFGEGQFGGQGQFGPGMRNTGAWQAAGPAQGPDWSARQAPPGPAGPMAGGWQPGPVPPGPVPPGQGQGWTPRPGGRGARDTGSWQAAPPPQQAPGWQPGRGEFGQGQYAPGQQQPYQGQPYQGQQSPGQQYAGPGGPGGPGLRNTGGFSRVGSPIIRQRDSALPDSVPGAKGPVAAIETDNVAAFARDLRVLRSKGGLDYPDMAEKSHYTMRTLASAAGGLRLPTLPVLIAYVNACGGDVAEWEQRWGKLTNSGKKSQGALVPASGQVPQGPAPQDPRQTGEIYVITTARDRDYR